MSLHLLLPLLLLLLLLLPLQCGAQHRVASLVVAARAGGDRRSRLAGRQRRAAAAAAHRLSRFALQKTVPKKQMIGFAHEIGKHCQFCKTLDVLPLKCECCDKVFCNEHGAPGACAAQRGGANSR